MPIKNISKTVTDVRRPRKKKELSPPVRPIAPKIASERTCPSGRRVWRRQKSIAFALLLIVGIYALAVINFKNAAFDKFQFLYNETKKLKEAIPEFSIRLITQSLESANKEIKAIESKARNYGILNASSLLGTFVPGFGQIPGALNNISLASETALAIAKDADYLKNNGFQLMAEQKGGELIGILERLKSNVTVLGHLGAEIKNQAFSLKNLSPELASLYGFFNENYIAVNLNLFRLEDFLGGLLSLLKSPGDQHILFIFQNPSEMRPAGGFIGSYGDLVLNQGNLEDIRIDDIYNADRQLDLKIIPPRELQGITKNWGARDANWFFDFPVSAQKVIYLLEQAGLHREESIQFHGAIAVNVNVLGSLLDIVGPVELPDYGLTLTGENFLGEIQYEVEAGRDKKPGQNPKRILSKLAPLLLEKISNLSEEQRNAVTRRAAAHLREKDIILYFKDWKLQNFLEQIGAAGEIFDVPKNFSGDYLAVVNANIGGGKTDAFISQRVTLESEISAGGSVTNKLSISRTHSGQNEKDWWYRLANKNYLKILVPQKAELIAVRGNDEKTPSSAGYGDGYMYDIDLKSMEGSQKFIEPFKVWAGREFEKASFGTWFTTSAGKTETLKITYKTGIDLDIRGGAQYKFIFEKQSGTNGSLEYSIAAPEGYIWEESGEQIFKYETQQLKAREIIELTLVNKI